MGKVQCLLLAHRDISLRCRIWSTHTDRKSRQRLSGWRCSAISAVAAHARICAALQSRLRNYHGLDPSACPAAGRGTRQRRHQAAGGLSRFSMKTLVAMASGRIGA